MARIRLPSRLASYSVAVSPVRYVAVQVYSWFVTTKRLICSLEETGASSFPYKMLDSSGYSRVGDSTFQRPGRRCGIRFDSASGESEVPVRMKLVQWPVFIAGLMRGSNVLSAHTFCSSSYINRTSSSFLDNGIISNFKLKLLNPRLYHTIDSLVVKAKLAGDNPEFFTL
ncbi:hypothetical protein Bbelb_086980 [Branchiostoma belcheri]|nr:hypothetical protein Bbelb_086980 [Branchiostoma belcheri]